MYTPEYPHHVPGTEESFELDIPPELLPHELINTDALHIAVAIAQHEVTTGEAAWTWDQILNQARLCREFITERERVRRDT